MRGTPVLFANYCSLATLKSAGVGAVHCESVVAVALNITPSGENVEAASVAAHSRLRQPNGCVRPVSLKGECSLTPESGPDIVLGFDRYWTIVGHA